MIGADTTFLVELELIEVPAHRAAHQILTREILGPQISLALASQVLAEFIHIVCRSFHVFECSAGDPACG